jgi:TolB-like protein
VSRLRTFVGRAAALVGLAAVSCAPTQVPVETPKIDITRYQVGAAVDIESKNLPAPEEIEALMQGEPEHGLIKNGVRMAVAPFEVLGGDDRKWLGEAVSEVMSNELARVDGVWVLEREYLDLITKQLKGASDEGAVSGAADKAKLLRAQYLVVGKVVPQGGRWQAMATPVRVRDGVRLPPVKFDLSEDDFASVGQPAAKLLAEVGIQGAAMDRGTPLSAADLKQATQARDLLLAGRLAEALPLFDQALAKPNDAWRLEGDYLRLMRLLGMYEWVEARGKDLLTRMPKGPAQTCPRARILTQMADASKDMARARDAVKAAASCGDSAVEVEALSSYALVAGDVDHQRSLAALGRAQAILAEEPNAYLKCLADFRLYFQKSNVGLDVGAGAANRFTEIAEACGPVGDSNTSALALSNAGGTAWSAKARIDLLSRSLELAKQVGGRRLTLVRINLARELRKVGRVSEADGLILEGMKERLERIAALSGGELPDPEVRLPRDLILQMGMTPLGMATSTPDTLTELRVKAHRTALSRLLHAWADRTAKATNAKAAASQAEAYHALARRLVGDEKLDDVSADYRRRLKDEAGIDFDALSEATEAPLYGEGFKAVTAASVLSSWFWALDRNAERALASKLVTTMRKVADWSHAPRRRMLALRAEGTHLLEQGKNPEALAAFESAAGFIVNAPLQATWNLNNRTRALLQTKPDEALALARKRVEVTRKGSAASWLNALYSQGWYGVGRSTKDVRAANDGLSEAASTFEKEGSWEWAAEAVRKLAILDREARRAGGTKVAVQLMSRRVGLLDKLSDPQRAIQGRLDLLNEYERLFGQMYGGNSGRNMRKNSRVKALANALERQAAELTKRQNFREAVRIVSQLPSGTPGLSRLSTMAMKWADQFKGSEEYAPLMAQINVGLAWSSTRRVDKKGYWRKAHEFFVEAGQVSAAVDQLSTLLYWSTDFDDAIELADECLGLAADNKRLVASCVEGVGKFALANGDIPKSTKMAAYARKGHELFVEIDRYRGAEKRMEYRTLIAILAVAGGDRRLANTIHDEVKRKLARSNPYEYAQHISRLAPVFGRTAPKRGLELYDDFFGGRGASAFFKFTNYPKAALLARRAGDSKREQELLDKGRKALKRYPAYVRTLALYESRRAREDGEWKEAAAAFGRGIELINETLPGYDVMVRHLQMHQTVAHQLAGSSFQAAKGVQTLVDAVDKKTLPFNNPCGDSRALEVAAGVLYAQGQCSRAEKLQEKAAERRKVCKPSYCMKTPASGRWCDSGKDFRAPNACRESFKVDDKSFFVY